MTDELWTLTAAELARCYREGGTTPAAVLEATFARLDDVNGDLNAIVTLDRDGASSEAKASTKRWQNGGPLSPLDGVPITVKDNIPVAGLRSTWGSRLYADWLPDRDETPVLRLREAGVVIVGKTNVPEMTLQGYTSNPIFGVTRNPWDRRLTPGGSSGGAVAAVASGIGPLALATDGGGSIRRPASYGGLVGLKPTVHRVPRHDGFPPILLDFEVIGLIARSVADLATGMAVISQDDPGAVRQDGFGPIRSSLAFAPKRILFVPTLAGAPVDAEIEASVAEAADRLRALGHSVEDGSGFDLADALNSAWPTIAQAGIAWLVREPSRRGLLGPDLLAMAEHGAKLSATDYFDALHTALVMRQDLARLFREVDVILTPTAAALPWPADVTHPPEIAGIPVGPRGSAIFTGFVNAAGLPGISIPSRPSSARLPIGFQLVGPWGGDGMLLDLALAYEQAHPWGVSWKATS